MLVKQFVESLSDKDCVEIVESFLKFEETGILPENLVEYTDQLVAKVGADAHRRVFWAEELAREAAFHLVSSCKNCILS